MFYFDFLCFSSPVAISITRRRMSSALSLSILQYTGGGQQGIIAVNDLVAVASTTTNLTIIDNYSVNKKANSNCNSKNSSSRNQAENEQFPIMVLINMLFDQR
jgi:hypothetical protein